jgi:hypothetical protein
MILSGESLSFSPVSIIIADGFGVDVLEVSMCSIIFSFTQIPMSFVAIYLFNRYSTALILRVGAFLFLSGSWVRSFWNVTGNFPPVLIG